MSRTVVVACKLPNGIRIGNTTVRGTARDPSVPFDPMANPGGYALTKGVPADAWEKWFKDNQDSAIVENKLIFAHESEQEVINQARRNRRTKSGLEPGPLGI